MKIISIVTLLFLLSFNGMATSPARARSLTLREGMNYSWLEQYWMGSASINYADYLDRSQLFRVKQQLQIMASLGFETLRLPVTFDKWEDRIAPYTFDSTSYFVNIDSVINWCAELNMNLIIVYHHGVLFDSNFYTELPRVIELWKQVATRYANTNPDKVFFELYNEPFDLSTAHWRTAAIALIDSMRPIVPNHTFIVGSTEWNSLYKLNEMGVLPDDNIIYNFHFYEPYIFTHQGATWSGPDLATTGIPFPYNSATMPPMNPLVIGTHGEGAYNYYYQEGTCQSIANALGIAASFALTNNVPLWCGEFGTYSAFTPNDDSRCRYIECVKTNLDNYQIPFAYWEWDEGFSIFNGTPSFANLSPCMQNIFDLTQAANPVSVTDIKGYNEKNDNILKWTPSVESNYTNFIVERSEDTQTFKEIGAVAGIGSSEFQHSFSFTDINCPDGFSYYRIKQTGISGSADYTKMISLRNKSGPLTARIYPNPSTDVINIKCDDQFTGLIITSIVGKEMKNLVNTNRADVSDFPPGMYVVKLVDKLNEVVATGKFIKN